MKQSRLLRVLDEAQDHQHCDSSDRDPVDHVLDRRRGNGVCRHSARYEHGGARAQKHEPELDLSTQTPQHTSNRRVQSHENTS